MTSTLALPSPSASREHHADWLELRVLSSNKRAISLREVIRDFKIGGVTDFREDWEEGDDIEDEDDLAESIAERAFEELHERQLGCGGYYPFNIDDEVAELNTKLEHGTYIFMALLSKYGKDAGPAGINTAKLFEDVCTKAITNYLGGGGSDAFVKSYAFGFPRRTLPTGFAAALNRLCEEMGEGVRSRGDQPKSRDQKDAKLDIVAWKEFADKRKGKLIAFGQCATGKDWTEKRIELPKSGDWCQLWMDRMPYVHPIRAFFVPHRVEFDEWERTCVYGGVLFDRCRIAHLATGLDKETAEAGAKWSKHVLREKLRR